MHCPAREQNTAGEVGCVFWQRWSLMQMAFPQQMFVFVGTYLWISACYHFYFTSKSNPQSTIWLYCDDLIIAKMTDDSDRWELAQLGAKKVTVEMFWLPSEQPVASARWWSWKRVCVGWDISLIMSLLTWVCIWCMTSLFMLPLCERRYFTFSFRNV